MKAFLGINILQGVIEVPHLDFYWSDSDFWGNAGVKKTMPRDRFKSLSSYMHINDNTTAVARGQQGYDPLHKIAPLYSAVRTNIQTQFNPGMCLAIDEAMIAYKGRSYLKQYLPSKPTKWGFKVWAIADSETGYMTDISIYTGKREHPSKYGLGYDVVMNLSQRYLGRYHHIFFDNLFVYIALVEAFDQEALSEDIRCQIFHMYTFVIKNNCFVCRALIFWNLHTGTELIN